MASFVDSFNADNRSARLESERFHAFAYYELISRDKANLDITWVGGVPPEIIAQEIVDDLTAALVEFSAVADALAARVPESTPM